MKKLFVLAIVITLGGSVHSQNVWTMDKAHAKLGFGVTHLMVSEIEGSFKSFDVKVTSAKEDFSDAQIELTADVSSINTDNEGRDKHLKSPDFFDAEKMATLTFKSTEFKQIEGKTYKLTGNLTMHGVTRWISLDVKFNGTAIHPSTKKPVAGFKITGTIKRSDFGIGDKFPATMISNEVDINANVEIDKV
jgi:polyisoprenoid-binding protein YceI